MNFDERFKEAKRLLPILHAKMLKKEFVEHVQDFIDTVHDQSVGIVATVTSETMHHIIEAMVHACILNCHILLNSFAEWLLNNCYVV